MKVTGESIRADRNWASFVRARDEREQAEATAAQLKAERDAARVGVRVVCGVLDRLHSEMDGSRETPRNFTWRLETALEMLATLTPPGDKEKP